jgi:hypothetical protein
MFAASPTAWPEMTAHTSSASEGFTIVRGSIRMSHVEKVDQLVQRDRLFVRANRDQSKAILGARLEPLGAKPAGWRS